MKSKKLSTMQFKGKVVLLLLNFVFLGVTFSVQAQSNFTTNPDSSTFLTSDIVNFWKAFDNYKKDTTQNPFGSQYIDIGSKGVKGFTPNRIENAGNLYRTVKKRSGEYESVRAATLEISKKEKQ